MRRYKVVLGSQVWYTVFVSKGEAPKGARFHVKHPKPDRVARASERPSQDGTNTSPPLYLVNFKSVECTRRYAN